MIDFIKKLGLDETTENALIGAWNEKKASFDKTITDLESVKSQIESDYKEKLKGFKDYDTIKEKVNELEQQISQKDVEIEQSKNRNINDRLDFEIEKRLLQGNYAHPELLKSAIDKSSIKYEDGKFNGLDEALNTIKEKYSDMAQANLKGATPQQKTKSPTQLDVNNMSAEDIAKNWTKIMEQRRK